MARDLTPQELALLREQLKAARTPDKTTQMTNVISVLSAVVEVLGESADMTLRARTRFDEAAGRQ